MTNLIYPSVISLKVSCFNWLALPCRTERDRQLFLNEIRNMTITIQPDFHCIIVGFCLKDVQNIWYAERWTDLLSDWLTGSPCDRPFTVRDIYRVRQLGFIWQSYCGHLGSHADSAWQKNKWDLSSRETFTLTGSLDTWVLDGTYGMGQVGWMIQGLIHCRMEYWCNVKWAFLTLRPWRFVLSWGLALTQDQKHKAHSLKKIPTTRVNHICSAVLKVTQGF